MQAPKVQVSSIEIIAGIIITLVIFLLICYFIVMLMAYFNKRKKVFMREKQELQHHYQQELLKTQIEVQEQTLINISREIHDNISQVLSFVKLSLAAGPQLSPEEKDEKMQESRELIAQAINDLRGLSRSLSFEHIQQLGLITSLEIEIDRINRSKLIEAGLEINGQVYSLGEQRELVLFRIFQEALNNTLKYAHAKHLKISLQYSDKLFNLTIADDGEGFLPEERRASGLGLKNMVSRAALIGAHAEIISAPGEGCCIRINLNPLIEQHTHAEGTYPDSAG